MAQSPYWSPSPSPAVESSPTSDSSSDDDFQSMGYEEASRPVSPQPAEGQLGQFPATEGDDTMTCQWEECGKVFNHLPSLIDHIHNGAWSATVPLRPSNYVARSHWRAQVQLHLRVEDVPPPRHRADLAFRAHLAHTLAHGRKAVYMSAPRYVCGPHPPGRCRA